MSRTSSRVVAALATAAISVVPIVAASPAGAATRPAPRDTAAMAFGELLGSFMGFYADDANVDVRSLKVMREVVAEMTPSVNKEFGQGFLVVTGLSDRNKDGLDDDGRFVVRFADNRATVTMHRDRSHTVADAGFAFRNPRSVLKESAQSFDRILRLVGRAADARQDPWDMALIKDLKAEMPAGVRVTSDHDGNHDGYDDDGRLTFLAGGKAVTLTIGNTPKQVGTVTYGATWQTRAPKRVHHPVAPPARDSASAKALARR
jgi:hypothetical protein